MLEGFFDTLKVYKVPVSLTEWMTLQQALDADLAQSSLITFYYLSRAILAKDETYFDRFDRAFKHYFSNVDTSEDMIKEILEGLNKIDPQEIEMWRRMQLPHLSLEEVLKNFQEQYEQGHYKQHQGGNKAIGVGGTSTQGAFGYNPAGIRIGQGESRHGRAIQIAEKRQFRNYDPNQVLDTRQIQVALSKLRTLLPVGLKDELDLEETIDCTCRNAGDLELVWRAERKNSVKLLLLMDTGGSMSPYIQIVNLLFSSAKSQFKELKHYYFHNCVYQELWNDVEQDDSIPTDEVLRSLDGDYKVIFVGDASMAPSELLDVNGAIDYFYNNAVPGIWWLNKIAARFPSTAWLVPDASPYWNQTMSARIIGKMFPMFQMTLEGLEEAMRSLVTTRQERMTEQEIKDLISNRYRPYSSRY